MHEYGRCSFKDDPCIDAYRDSHRLEFSDACTDRHRDLQAGTATRNLERRQPNPAIQHLHPLLPRWQKEGSGRSAGPEGIYAITGFNPKSSSYKTLNLNYPNAFDRSQGATGGGIGIHGKCASVGCIGMRNDQMDSIEKALKKELKRLPIPVLIFYSEKSERVERLIQLFKKQGNDTEVKFLERLEKVREYWNLNHRVPKYGWDKYGYLVKK